MKFSFEPVFYSAEQAHSTAEAQTRAFIRVDGCHPELDFLRLGFLRKEIQEKRYLVANAAKIRLSLKQALVAHLKPYYPEITPQTDIHGGMLDKLKGRGYEAERLVADFNELHEKYRLASTQLPNLEKTLLHQEKEFGSPQDKQIQLSDLYFVRELMLNRTFNVNNAEEDIRILEIQLTNGEKFYAPKRRCHELIAEINSLPENPGGLLWVQRNTENQSEQWLINMACFAPLSKTELARAGFDSLLGFGNWNVERRAALVQIIHPWKKNLEDENEPAYCLSFVCREPNSIRALNMAMAELNAGKNCAIGVHRASQSESVFTAEMFDMTHFRTSAPAAMQAKTGILKRLIQRIKP